MLKVFAQNLNSDTRSSGVFEWIKLATITGSAQVVIQGLGILSGFIIIRVLSTREYALYTLVNIMVGTMTILADGGISSAIMGEGGKVWNDRKKLGIVLTSGLYLRKKFAIGSLLIASPVLFFLLRHHGASLLMSFVLLGSLVPAFLTALSSTLLEISPKLKQDIAPLQKIQVGVNFGRLAILTSSLFAFPWAFVAILSAGVPQIWGNFRLRKISGKYTDWEANPDPVIEKKVLMVVKRMLPTAIYFCISGQITIWLISIFGSTQSVAQIGALGRLAMILSIFNILFATIITPRFARLSAEKSLLIKRYTQVLLTIIGLSVGIVAVTWIFNSKILWILGDGYQNLQNELFLNIIGSCLALIAGVSYTLYTSRGWVIKPIVSIPINIIAIALCVFFLDISTLKGILMLNILVALTQVFMNVIFIFLKMSKVESQYS